MPYLSSLKPGTRFRLAEMPKVTGVLVRVNECRAVVRLDRPEREVEFHDANGETRQFRSRGSQTTSWAPTTVVEPVSFQDLKEYDMSKTATKKTKAPKSESTKGKTKTKAATGEPGTKAVAELFDLRPKGKGPSEKKATKTEKPPKEKKAAKKDGKLSGLDAAAKVLAEAGTPLKGTEIVERALAKRYWQTNGQTPSATLYSAMLREINVKGKESRFKRTDKGTFALA
jgi:hypothetical protein